MSQARRVLRVLRALRALRALRVLQARRTLWVWGAARRQAWAS